MTHSNTGKNVVRWRSVAVLSTALVVCILSAALLWPKPAQLPRPIPIIDPPPPFEPSAEFEAANDLAILRAVVLRECNSEALIILSSKLDGFRGGRGSQRADAFPDDLKECPSVKVVDTDELDELFSAPYRGKVDFKHQGGWGNFYQAYPNAIGILHVSLPSYVSPTSATVKIGRTCGYLCGSGWKFKLKKVDGKWTIQEQEPTWIA